MGEVLFTRGSLDGESTADDWDDTELLKEYERAVRPIKALVAERMGLSNLEVGETSATESCASSRSATIPKNSSKAQKRNQKKKHRKSKQKQQREWAVGDHCQAQFAEDSKWYEATILVVNQDRGTCTVQYVGYGNKEEVPLTAIGQSMGAAVRREQSRTADLEKDLDVEASPSDDMFEHSSQASSILSQSQSFISMNKSKASGLGKQSKSFAHSHLPIFSGPSPFPGAVGSGVSGFPGLASQSPIHDMVAPPLPPHILTSLPSDDSEALSAMLMSWYMSGFHTGYYQGLKRARNIAPSP